jgi:hypothetical protein
MLHYDACFFQVLHDIIIYRQYIIFLGYQQFVMSNFIAANIHKACFEDAWSRLHLSDTLQYWLREGVRIPLNVLPNPFELKNHRLSRNQETFVDKEIITLLQAGAIEKCSNKPLCVSPIGVVPKKNKKFRLITDLRQLNSSCRRCAFQYEDINTVSNIVADGDHMITLDIQNGFYHIKVHRLDRDYLGFKWRNQYFRWRVLPFGLSCSPYYFGKILRPVVIYLREQRVKLCAYVDDFLVAAPKVRIEHDKDLLIDTLVGLGWYINYEKSSLLPEQDKNYIGYHILTKGDPIIKIPLDRCRKLKKDIKRVIDKKILGARLLARVTGQCVSMFKAIAPGKLMLRNVYKVLARRQSWDDVVILDKSATEDLRWWIHALDGWNGEVIHKKIPEVQIICDASPFGFGAICGSWKAAGFWSNQVANRPQNAREMMAILTAVHTFGPRLKNKSVQVVTDNISAMAYINHMGGPSLELTNLAKNIWATANQFGIRLTATYLAGCLNVEADYLSRLSTQYEWTLHPRLFQYIQRRWGPHTIDRFANMGNHVLPKYNSRFMDPLCSGVDALAQSDWSSENNYVNPPFRLLNQVIDKIIMAKAWATVIAPAWPGQIWFQKLLSITVCPPLRIPKVPGAILKKVMPGQAEPMKNHRWKIYAWRVYGGQN